MLSRKQFRRVLKICSHVLCNPTQSNRGKVVDGKSGVFRIVHREQARKCRCEIGNPEPFHQFIQTHLLQHLLHRNLDEDTRRRRRFLFIHVHNVEDRP